MYRGARRRPPGRRRRAPLFQLAAQRYPDVDVAIVTESTYPYLTGGLPAVVHDIVQGNQDLTFGIIHITWDSASPATRTSTGCRQRAWLRPVYLSMREHREDFKAAAADEAACGWDQEHERCCPQYLRRCRIDRRGRYGTDVVTV